VFSGYSNFHIYPDSGLRDRGQQMNIEHADHFMIRCEERAENGESPPLARIERIGRLVAIDEEFHVRTYSYIYVCKRISERSIVIVTILYNVANKHHTTRQCRKEIGRRRRLGRIDKWNREEED
jgi:hypothetical protein